mmetsp:Transcript_22053/g.49778  ORF Transcript_22053/g.49778 Transcript_22053/m.49778 type:complete len:124 (+) Transcript_22053:59-430(+)
MRTIEPPTPDAVSTEALPSTSRSVRSPISSNDAPKVARNCHIGPGAKLRGGHTHRHGPPVLRTVLRDACTPSWPELFLRFVCCRNRAKMELAEEGKAQEAAVMGPVGAEMGAAEEETGMIRRR